MSWKDSPIVYLLFLTIGLEGFLGMRGPPRILRRNLRTLSRTPCRLLCSDNTSLDHGLQSTMSIAATARALPTWEKTEDYSHLLTRMECSLEHKVMPAIALLEFFLFPEKEHNSV